MRILIDTNVILDMALEREPFAEHAALLFKTAHEESIQMFMTATTITDLYYIYRKEKGKDAALSFIRDLLQFVQIASVGKKVIFDALKSGVSDFEDAVQVCSAKQEGIETVITRNEKDFAASGLDIQRPESFLRSLEGDVQK